MSLPSSWPLPANGVRHILPRFILEELAGHPLARELYPRSFGFYPEAAGHRTERDSHDDWLLVFCSAGHGHVHTAAAGAEVGPGDLLLLRRGVTHRYEASERDPWSIHFVHFSGTLADAFLTHADGTPVDLVTHVGPAPKLRADFDALLAIRRSGYDVPALVHAANVLRQMLTWLRAIRPQHAEHGALLDTVHALMEQHLHGQLELDTMAAATGLSRYHFAKKYKQLTGESPVQRFIHRKIQHACYLLDLSTQPIGDIARSLGYDDVYYFSRLFRKVVGISPSAYRQERHG